MVILQPTCQTSRAVCVPTLKLRPNMSWFVCFHVRVFGRAQQAQHDITKRVFFGPNHQIVPCHEQIQRHHHVKHHPETLNVVEPRYSMKLQTRASPFHARSTPDPTKCHGYMTKPTNPTMWLDNLFSFSAGDIHDATHGRYDPKKLSKKKNSGPSGNQVGVSIVMGVPQ